VDNAGPGVPAVTKPKGLPFRPTRSDSEAALAGPSAKVSLQGGQKVKSLRVVTEVTDGATEKLPAQGRYSGTGHVDPERQLMDISLFRRSPLPRSGHGVAHALLCRLDLGRRLGCLIGQPVLTGLHLERNRKAVDAGRCFVGERKGHRRRIVVDADAGGQVSRLRRRRIGLRRRARACDSADYRVLFPVDHDGGAHGRRNRSRAGRRLPVLAGTAARHDHTDADGRENHP